ncbi:unnamed protein product [Caenorhabditis sp. 36 PRJEB53466]|nr:unnamed protein product [Caenorhabditis sp. 36 PRJEB53466]
MISSVNSWRQGSPDFDEFPDEPKWFTLQFLDVPDIIDFSLCSARARDAVRALKHREMRIAAQVAERGVIQISSGEKDGSKPLFEWTINKAPFEGGLPSKYLNGVKLETEKPRDGIRFTSRAPYIEEAMIGVITYFSDLFQTHIHTFMGKLEDQATFSRLLTALGKCEKVTITIGQDRDVIFRQALESLSVSEVLEVTGGPKPSFKIDKVFRTKQLLFKDARWVTRANFLNMQCDTIVLHRCLLTVADFKVFLERWASGTNKSFYFLFVVLEDSDMNLEPLVLDKRARYGGIKVAPWDRRKRGRFYNTLDLGDGLDIERPDGRLGTFGALRNNFFFVTWKNRFPKKIKNGGAY